MDFGNFDLRWAAVILAIIGIGCALVLGPTPLLVITVIVVVGGCYFAWRENTSPGTSGSLGALLFSLGVMASLLIPMWLTFAVRIF